MRDVGQLLRDSGVHPSPQRQAVAAYVLATEDHPTAEEVWRRVKSRGLSRATVYNTLSTLVERGLLRRQTLSAGREVYDPNVGQHHHFIDDKTGRVYDVPWEAVKVYDVGGLKGFEVDRYSVVMHGRRRR
jgi:Fe2+ or Zn2+ uptake regulation protein